PTSYNTLLASIGVSILSTDAVNFRTDKIQDGFQSIGNGNFDTFDFRNLRRHGVSFIYM
ncbi:Hypothetical predicted protein, partial [Paramuricea clavata]